MLVWLNGNQNISQKPNENYARELMELFTLGANRGAYTETDVREQARALTGWQGNVVNRQSTGFVFNTARHDTGTKTIFGKIGQLQLGGLVPALPRQPAAPVVLRREDVELLRPDEDRQRHVEGAAGALREPARSSPSSSRSCCTRPSTRARAWSKPPVVLNAGLLRMRGRYVDTSAWWTIGQQAGQQLFYPPDVGGWDDTRWLDTATFRARWFMAAHRPGRLDAARQPERPGAAARPRARVLGLARRSRRRRRACSSRSRRRSSSATIDAGNVETALRRLDRHLPGSADRMSCYDCNRLRQLPARGGGRGRPAGDRGGHAAPRRHRAVAAQLPLASRPGSRSPSTAARR